MVPANSLIQQASGKSLCFVNGAAVSEHSTVLSQRVTGSSTRQVPRVHGGHGQLSNTPADIECAKKILRNPDLQTPSGKSLFVVRELCCPQQ